MTNEEAYNIISEFCFTGYEDNKKPSARLFNAIRELVCEVHENAELRDYKGRLEQENTKLKAEIKEIMNIKKSWIDVCYDLNDKLKKAEAEIENFKILAEEQSKLTIEQFKQIDEQYQEIEQLKLELKQSVKEKSEVISEIEYALNECEPIYNKCAVIPQAKPIYDLAMNYCLDLLKGQVPE